MTENEVPNQEKQEDGKYQITVVNIKYGQSYQKKQKEKPDMVVLDVPEALLKTKDKEKFMDSIEAFAYNTITKKYGSEVSHCQVYLPM